jgi:hypothetical protein
METVASATSIHGGLNLQVDTKICHIQGKIAPTTCQAGRGFAPDVNLGGNPRFYFLSCMDPRQIGGRSMQQSQNVAELPSVKLLDNFTNSDYTSFCQHKQFFWNLL